MNHLKDHFHISELISKEQFSELSGNEKAILDEWINTSEENKELYLSLKQSNNIQSKFNSYAIHNVDQNWKRFIAKRGAKLFRFNQVFKYAAIFVLLIGVGGYFFVKHQLSKDYSQFKSITQSSSIPIDKGNGYLILSNGEKVILEEDNSKIKYRENSNLVFVNGDTISNVQKARIEKKKIAFNQLLVPYGKSSQIVLIDGTTIWLNAGSKLVYPEEFIGNKREIYLEGEAYFDVAKNPLKPFVVITSGIEVKVLGTSFNVSAYPKDKDISTVLVSGKINLKRQGKLLAKELEMIPNQRVVYEKTSGDYAVDSVNVAYFTSWKEGQLLFESENLSNLLTKLERYYNVQTVLADPDLKDYKITGKLNLKDNITDVCMVISNIIPVEYSIQNEQVIFKFKEDKQ